MFDPTEPRFPINRMKYKDFKHIIAFKPNGCIQIDMFSLGGYIPINYRLATWYTIGVDVYSRYMCIHVNTDDEGNVVQNLRGNIFTNFKELLELFTELPDMVVVDAEFDKKQVKDFCRDNNIKMYRCYQC
jgi:hypothetical protein